VSTLPTANLFPSWKEEVNRRVADHRNRKAAPANGRETVSATHAAQTDRAARAAERVAARYANAPSYNQMLAEEARAAMRAAEAAQMAAEDAHAAVQMALAGLDAARSTETAKDLRAISERAAGETLLEARNVAQSAEPVGPAAHDAFSDAFSEMRLAPLEALHSSAQADGSEQAIPGNLIQFPREMVATRRLRPRRIEGPLAELESAPQLSIFEVEPAYVSNQPAAPVVDEQEAPEWMRPGWRALEAETAHESAPEKRAQQRRRDETATQTAASPITDLATLNRRAMAAVIDGALTMAAFAVVVWLAGASGMLVHSARAFEFVAVILFLMVVTGYQALFSALTMPTPGMWYAGIGLCTIEGYIPDRAHRWRRLAALPLSVMPLGLGLAWSLFDEDRLTWHDRLSETYLRLR
jgi:uncharacterized RDD family membrane protein YckC